MDRVPLLRRAFHDLARIPDGWHWTAAGLCFLALLMVALLFSVRFGFPKLGLAPLGDPRLWLWVAFIFVSPGITEEVLFRSWILRHPEEVSRPEFAARIAAGLVLYLAWHPLLLGHLVRGRMAIFSDPRFLILTLFLGIGASFLYLHSRSLWPSIVFHWTVVAAWYLFGGGYLLLHAPG